MEEKRKPTTFHALFGGKYYTIVALKHTKNKVHLVILMYVCDKVMDIVIEKQDLIDTWNILKE